MTYTLQNLLADFDDEFELHDLGHLDKIKHFMKEKITKLVTEAVGIIDELPDREMSSQVKDTREWMNFGRNQLRQQILSVISQE